LRKCKLIIPNLLTNLHHRKTPLNEVASQQGKCASPFGLLDFLSVPRLVTTYKFQYGKVKIIDYLKIPEEENINKSVYSVIFLQLN
jgi:hypothetical protein